MVELLSGKKIMDILTAEGKGQVIQYSQMSAATKKPKKKLSLVSAVYAIDSEWCMRLWAS